MVLGDRLLYGQPNIKNEIDLRNVYLPDRYINFFQRPFCQNQSAIYLYFYLGKASWKLEKNDY